MDRILLKLYLKDSHDNVKYEYNYQFNEEELKKTNAKAKRPITASLIHSYFRFADTESCQLIKILLFGISKQAVQEGPDGHSHQSAGRY